jgi:type VI secretion system secreted protein VgrG
MSDSPVQSGVRASIAVAGAAYRVHTYAMRERLSEVSTLACTIDHDDSTAPDPASLVDQTAVLTLESNDGTMKRTFAGKVVSADRREQGDDVHYVALEIAPAAWRLSQRRDCRTFQKMSVVDIVTAVLAGAGVTQTAWNTTGSYSPRDYTVQYRETDLAFIARLLSEEGIYFAIDHDDGTDTLAFGDDPTGLGDVSGTTSLGFRPSFGSGEVGDFVFQVERRHEVRSDKTTLRDYDPDKPQLKLESAALADGEKGELEVYCWPGKFDLPKDGDRLAQVLLDSLRATRDVVVGLVGSLSLRCGYRFSVEGHPYAPLNQEYLVIGVDTDGQDARNFAAGSPDPHRYACRFHAVPTKTTQYRPPRVERAQTAAGVQTAITTGPPGEEIHTDEHGHVTAQFPWDRLGKNDDSSSCWMRTSQAPTGGSMLLPRMGWEVAVRYLEGDVDRPFVMSRLYNGATMPPYELPANKVRSSLQTATTPGGGSTNELRTHDGKGSEEMFFNASKDMSIDVGNNTTESVGNNQTRTVGANHTLNVTNSVSSSIGSDQTIEVDGSQNVHVQTFFVDQVAGDHSLTIGATRDMHVGGDHKREVAGDNNLTVGGPMIDLVVGASNEHILGNVTHTVGAALVEATGGGRSVIVGGNRTETTGALKVIATKAGRGVDVGGVMNATAGGAIIRSVDGDLEEKSGAAFTEIAAGATILKATNISIEGETMLTVVMGASTISMMPAMVTIAGASLKVDGEVVEGVALVMDN